MGGIKKVIITEAQWSDVFKNLYNLILGKRKKYSYKSDFQSVGEGGVNKIEDVKYVLILFKCSGVDVSGIVKKCKGNWGECQEFFKLIRDYQKNQFGWQDGLIEPKKPTITRLLAICNGEFNPKTKEKINSSDKKKLQQKKNKPNKKQTITKSPANFDQIVGIVIDRLEGGYYHPDMLKDGRIKDKRYSNSGETMMGIDRKAGGRINKTPLGEKFWSLIDNANARKNWKWNYRGGNLESQLRQLAGQMIKLKFLDNTKRYLSPESQEIINKDNRLLFHFIYATWNGSGWFQRFARKINQAVENGVTNSNDLYKVAINSRLNSKSSLIKQTGKKMLNILG